MNITRVGIVGTLLLTVVVGFVIFQSMGAESITCEVCMNYKRQQQCRTVGAATRELAVQGAITNACAYISNGVTDSMACGRGTPASERCW